MPSTRSMTLVRTHGGSMPSHELRGRHNGLNSTRAHNTRRMTSAAAWRDAETVVMLTEEMRRMVDDGLAFVATVNADGTPNLSPKGTVAVWDDDRLVFADIASPNTSANLERNAAVELNVVDPLIRRGYRFAGTGEAHRAERDLRGGDRVLRATAARSTARERIHRDRDRAGHRARSPSGHGVRTRRNRGRTAIEISSAPPRRSIAAELKPLRPGDVPMPRSRPRSRRRCRGRPAPPGTGRLPPRRCRVRRGRLGPDTTLAAITWVKPSPPRSNTTWPLAPVSVSPRWRRCRQRIGGEVVRTVPLGEQLIERHRHADDEFVIGADAIGRADLASIEVLEDQPASRSEPGDEFIEHVETRRHMLQTSRSWMRSHGPSGIGPVATSSSSTSSCGLPSCWNHRVSRSTAIT